MLTLQFYIEGELQLSRRLEGIAANIQDWTPAFEKSSNELLGIFEGPVFESEGEAIAEYWSPLSKAYAYRKEKLYPGKGILEATGAMRASFMSKFDATSMTIWNEATYFKYHQSRLPRHVLPRRAMLKLTENMRQGVVKNFQAQFVEAAGL